MRATAKLGQEFYVTTLVYSLFYILIVVTVDIYGWLQYISWNSNYRLFTPSLPCFKVNMIQVLGSNEVNKGFSNIARVIFTHLSLVTCNATSEHWHDSTCTRSQQRLLLWKSYRSSNKQHWLLTARSRMHWELNILYHLRNARTNVHVL